LIIYKEIKERKRKRKREKDVLGDLPKLPSILGITHLI
jgi:hypothetical protein